VAARPDVYIIVLDGYGRADVLRDSYHFENPLVPALETRGFTVASKAVANYSQTMLSLASALNGNYLSSLLDPATDAPWARRALGDLIHGNALFNAFRSAGYAVRVYASEYAMLRPGPADTRLRTLVTPTSFDYGFYEATAFPSLSTTFGFPRGLIPQIWRMGSVKSVIADLRTRRFSSPTLTFVHLLIPHPPFVFNANGAARNTRVPMLLNDASHWTELTRGSGEQYHSGYIAAVEYVNEELIRTIDEIDRRAVSSPVFYIQGDHGPGSRLLMEDIQHSDPIERQSILLAMRPAAGSIAPLPSRITPVNSVRFLLNSVLGTHFSALQDRSYMSRWSTPLRLVDVSGAVNLLD
jgi:hypothetical protein